MESAKTKHAVWQRNKLVRLIRARPRLFIATACAVALGILLPEAVARQSVTRWLIAWNFGTGLYVLLAAIMMIRNFRTPLAVKLQAAGEFKALAGIGTKSCALSVVGVLGLLLAFGPIASLFGIVAGESVILFEVRRLCGQWQARHG